ncbi:MAG: DPP IV N-terminal domain-containing protein [bacterium]|nr:DPP IV N-terminal domain-containing protein [Acidimicrobiia bacterium]MCY4649941.1 DPP IV N-terminal domain-containing protein [bacterium]
MGPGSRPAMWERYRRAEQMLHRNVNSLVFNLQTPVHWLPDSSGFWYRCESASGHRFMLVDAPTGRQQEAFDHRGVARALTQVLAEEVDPAALPFETFEFACGGSRVRFKVDGSRWECRVDGSSLRKWPAPAPGRGSASPSGRYEARTVAGNLVLIDHIEGSSTPLTDDAEPAHGYGSSPEGRNSAVTDRLGKRETPPRVVWSPDERNLLTHRLDERRVQKLHLWQGAPRDGSLRPRVHSYRQALPDDAELPLAQLVVFEVETSKRVDLQWRPLESSFLTPIELNHVWWASGGDTVFFLDWDRDRRSVRLVSADPSTGECNVMVEERSETPIDLNAVYYGAPNVWVAKDRREIIWYSARSGFGHLYLLDGRGDPIRQLTGGQWLVTDLVRVDEKTRTAFFMGTGREPSRDPYYHHLYAVSLDGGEPVLLTPEEAEHGEWPPWVDFSPDGRYFVDRFSRIDQPPRTVLRRSTGELVAQVTETDVSALRATGWRYPERFTAKASDGQTDLYGMIVLPHDFDPARKYPVIESIYPGPQATRTPRGFTDVVGESTRCLAELGFVVFTVDGRGTPGRSRAFLDAGYGRSAEAEVLADHVAVLTQLAEERPYLDLDRVGIYGHSAGGYAAVRAMLEYPQVYRVGVASAGNHDQALTNVTWGERWIGPVGGPGWDTQANRTLAGNLQGKLLLVTGDLDDNVNPAATMQLVDALIAANRDFDLLVLPNRNHDFAGTWGTWSEDPYFTRRRWDYFVEHLMGEQPPPGYQVGVPG